MSRFVALLFVVVSLSANLSRQEEISTSTTNQNVNINNNQETIKWGNRKTNNYNFHENHYRPTQVTQLYLDMTKSAKDKSKLRKSRRPTVEEFEIKQRILRVYEAAQEEVENSSVHLNHLGRIIKALNPKYIATNRVMRVAFADPFNPDVAVNPPELETQQAEEAATTPLVQSSDLAVQPTILQLGSADVPVGEQLDAVAKRFYETFEWDKNFAQQLFQIEEEHLNPDQLAFKRLIQCLTFPNYCKKPLKPSKKVKSSQPQAFDQHFAPNIISEVESRIPTDPASLIPQQQRQQQQPPRSQSPNNRPLVKQVRRPVVQDESRWQQQQQQPAYQQQAQRPQQALKYNPRPANVPQAQQHQQPIYRQQQVRQDEPEAGQPAGYGSGYDTLVGLDSLAEQQHLVQQNYNDGQYLREVEPAPRNSVPALNRYSEARLNKRYPTYNRPTAA